MGINSWEMRGVGGNEVPVEGRNRGIVNGESYCDDRVLVRYDQMDRLCVMIRVLTVILTMELVILGYVSALYDVLQCLVSGRIPYEVSERERVVCGAASDGGVYAARTETMDGDYDQNVSSLDGFNNETNRRGDITLEINDGEQETQDDGYFRHFDLEQTDESTQ